MTDAEVVAFLRKVRYSDKRERNAHRALSINAIATKARTSGPSIYRTIHGQSRPSRRIRQAVESLVRLGA